MTMELWTTATPNGWKISIMIEELREAGIELPGFSVRTINIMKGEQFTAEFTAANPNQKIPVLIDDGRPIMESGAILQYLGEKFPNAGLLPEGPARWDVLQWLYWQVANVGPVFGNKLSYTRYMPDVEDLKKSHPLERFGKEARRLSGVLNDQLEGRDYVCGEFSIADIALYPWIRGWKWSKVDITDRPNVMAWVERVRARPGVGRGLAYGVPKEEVDQWSADTKARYARGGATMASNDD
jgi:GST-like protein